jgi:hypothetical protein
VKSQELKMKQLLLLAIAISMITGLFATPLWENPVPVRQGDAIRWNRCGAVTADGCMIYVWSGTLHGSADIFAQKVDAAGNILWQQSLVVQGTPSSQISPVITRTTDNNLVIAWLEYNSDEENIIRAQKITSNGQLLWLNGGVPLCSIPQYIPAFEIVADHANGAFITWVDSRNSSYDIYSQHLDAYGNSLWQTDGLAIASGQLDESSFVMCVDITGALNVAYRLDDYANHNNPVKLTRILGNGLAAWNQPLTIADTNNTNSNSFQMTALADSSVVLTWSGSISDTEVNPDIYAQKVNPDGTMLWTNPVTVFSDAGSQTPAVQEKPRITASDNNSVIIAWDDYRNDYDYESVYVQKVDAAGNLLWNPNGVSVCVDAPGQRGERLVSDNNGGCYVAWQDIREMEYSLAQLYAQHVSASGNILWENQGRAICIAPNEQFDPMIRVINGNVFIGWGDMRDGSVSLYYQVLNPQGNPVLTANGRLIHQGMSGDAVYNQTMNLARSSDAVIMWVDSRCSNLGYQIYYQFLNPDGSADLEPNGRTITLTTENNNNQSNFSAIVTPDDKLCIVWEENTNVKAQLISADGTRLWGENGICVTDTVLYRQKDAKVSYDDGAFYIGWSDLKDVQTDEGPRMFFRIYAQKVVNDQKQWDANGVLLSEYNNETTLFEDQLEAINGRYFVWTRTNLDPASWGYLNIWVKSINPDGTTAQGWNPDGIATTDYWDWDTQQYRPQCVVTNAGLFIAWLDWRVDFIRSVYGQLISPQGELLWDQSGVPFTEGEYETNDFAILGGSDITLLWSTSYTSDISIRANKFSLNHAPLWGEEDLQISSEGEYYGNGINVSLARFANGGLLAAWEAFFPYSDTDIYYRYIHPDGIALGASSSCLISAPDNQYFPKLAAIGNEAFLTWSDTDFYHDNVRCGDGYYANFNLYAQKLSNEVVAVEDDELPSAAISLEQNYPNPFNPETNICFSLKASSDAELCIYNLKGQKVKTLHSGLLEKGRHTLVWNGTDDEQKSVSSGVYFYKLTSGKFTSTRKMVLLK